jgi:hypothetical protein
MKTHSLTLPAAVPPRSRGRFASLVRRADSLPYLAFMILVSAIPPIGLVILATWASNQAVGLPLSQAATALSGLVFLALALDAGRNAAIALVATAIALFALAWASTVLSAEWVIMGSMVIAVWAGLGLFTQFRVRCL